MVPISVFSPQQPAGAGSSSGSSSSGSDLIEFGGPVLWVAIGLVILGLLSIPIIQARNDRKRKRMKEKIIEAGRRPRRDRAQRVSRER